MSHISSTSLGPELGPTNELGTWEHMGQSTYLGSLAKCCNERLVNTWQAFFKQTSKGAQAKHSQ